jgi:hypothetical protein
MQLLRRHNRQQLEKLAADPQSRLSPEAHALLKWAVDETPVALGLHALATLPDSAPPTTRARRAYRVLQLTPNSGEFP